MSKYLTLVPILAACGGGKPAPTTPTAPPPVVKVEPPKPPPPCVPNEAMSSAHIESFDASSVSFCVAGESGNACFKREFTGAFAPVPPPADEPDAGVRHCIDKKCFDDETVFGVDEKQGLVFYKDPKDATKVTIKTAAGKKVATFSAGFEANIVQTFPSTFYIASQPAAPFTNGAFFTSKGKQVALIGGPAPKSADGAADLFNFYGSDPRVLADGRIAFLANAGDELAIHDAKGAFVGRVPVEVPAKPKTADADEVGGHDDMKQLADGRIMVVRGGSIAGAITFVDLATKAVTQVPPPLACPAKK